MDTLKQTVREVVAGYTGRALNGYSYLTQSDDRCIKVRPGLL